ncbi:hypothetical protein ACP3T3_15125 [Chryseobacterium sp. CBSDS_008]|uniref:hypothetical protein n=1 Tax=Chryseobacterium sp. CBSDS_008 TaxID=3415265 RepID=UPI003CEBE547
MKDIILYVNGIFQMSFGKTFFTGIMHNHDAMVENSFWELIVNGKKMGTIEIEGEQIVKKIDNINEYRSLATKIKIDNDIDLKKDIVQLVMIK